MKQRRRAQKFILHHEWTCHLKNAKLEAKLLMEIGFCGKSLRPIMGEMCWASIEQRGTWHETDGGYLCILVVWILDPVASETMLLTETCTL